MDTVLFSIIRTVISYLLLLIVTRFIGRKAISQMTFFDFAVAISLGSVTANIGIITNDSFTSGITVLITIGTLAVITGILHIINFKFNKLVNSEPVVLINNGEMAKRNMKKLRITINELNALLRQKNIFSINDVNYAILENNGKLSVLPKADKKPLTPFDMQMHPPETGLTREIIIDGRIMHENLKATNLTEKWLFNELQKIGISSVGEVFFAGLEASGNLYVTKGIKNAEKRGEYGIE